MSVLPPLAFLTEFGYLAYYPINRLLFVIWTTDKPAGQVVVLTLVQDMS